jgi:hypothetical protein
MLSGSSECSSRLGQRLQQRCRIATDLSQIFHYLCFAPAWISPGSTLPPACRRVERCLRVQRLPGRPPGLPSAADLSQHRLERAQAGDEPGQLLRLRPGRVHRRGRQRNPRHPVVDRRRRQLRLHQGLLDMRHGQNSAYNTVWGPQICSNGQSGTYITYYNDVPPTSPTVTSSATAGSAAWSATPVRPSSPEPTPSERGNDDSRRS